MANKLSISIDAVKARELIQKRSYTNKEGVNVTVQEIKFELVELAPDKQEVLRDEKDYQAIKTHFAAKKTTTEERAAGVKPFYVGEAIKFVPKNAQQPTTSRFEQVQNLVQVEDDLPF
jgi:hypothetical protein